MVTAKVLLTIGGRALLGAGCSPARFPACLGWLTFGADLILLAGYLSFEDIPPFVCYLLRLLSAWRALPAASALLAYTMPRASIASATFTKPPMFAPST